MVELLAVALFLPLFPMSGLAVVVLTRLPPALRAVAFLFWPGVGVALLSWLAPPIPEIVAPWALLTAAIYAFRLLTVRDLALWTGLFATSAYALVWLEPLHGALLPLVVFLAAFALPASGLALVGAAIARRLGAAYAGLAATLTPAPRLAFLFAVILLAAVATPPAPGFSALLALLMHLTPVLALGVLLVWLAWSWAAMRLLAGFLGGGQEVDPIADVGVASLGLGLGFAALVTGAGLYWLGRLG
ncbi:hypothetical protein [Thiobacter aerophilum]|uniref:NADH:quinone oxidoreductase/Mrp antiporter membrane subunit domain-containing protein n=1 Tax=Thiobacter aerophilum TaxID=3121275 RepID=A0ABV0EGG1_9BURK